MSDKPGKPPSELVTPGQHLPASDLVRRPLATDEPELTPVALAHVMDAFGNAMRAASEPEAQASVRKAEIEAGIHEKAIDAESKTLERRDNYDQERFRWILGGTYFFSAVLLAVAIGLIFTGKLQSGLLIVSHMVTLGVGILGGRGLAAKRPDKDEKDE